MAVYVFMFEDISFLNKDTCIHLGLNQNLNGKVSSSILLYMLDGTSI
jgi:hypothetical protein